MYKYQRNLPSLPVPDLQKTMERYLQWIQPLINEEEYKNSIENTNNFLTEDGEKLQNKLLEWDKNTEGSWLKPFWDASYLEFRNQLAANMNYFIMMQSDEINKGYSIAQLCGKIIYSLTKTYHHIINETLEPETIKDKPLCMDQYINTLKACRIPEKAKDLYYVGQKDNKNNHIILLYKSNFFKLNVSDEFGNIMSIYELEKTIDNLLNTYITEGESIGVFTTAKRDEAANIYRDLKTSNKNRANFETIENALFALCIDEEINGVVDDVKNSLISNGRNRYFDKCCQVIVTKSGSISFNNEHTGADGTTWFTIIGQVYKDLIGNELEDVFSKEIPAISKLDWEVDRDTKKMLDYLEYKHGNSYNGYALEVIEFNNFGKGRIKQLGVSPDAFFHIALQLAQYKVFGKLKSTYEPVAVRNFYQGRTECARASSKKALQFAEAYVNEATDKNQLKTLLKKACDAHVDRLKECQAGHGVERHLYGLQMMYKLYGEQLGITTIPAIFEEEGFKTLKHDSISTSGLGAEYVRFFGFGPVIEDGFGVGYGVKDEIINICITSKKANEEKLRKLAEHIKVSLQELYNIFAN